MCTRYCTKTNKNTQHKKEQPEPQKKKLNKKIKGKGGTHAREDISRVTTNIVGDRKNYIKKRKKRLSFEKLIFRHGQPVYDDD